MSHVAGVKLLQDRAAASGDAASLLAPQFVLALGLAASLDAPPEGGHPAALFREFRLLLADIVAVVEDRGGRAGAASIDRLAALLAGHD